MASQSLLVTNYHEKSDLYEIFGPDCPVPTFKDEAELRSICKYYLSNEEKRLEIVQKCNALVAQGFSFEERCADIAKLVNVDIGQRSTRKGTISHVSVYPHYHLHYIIARNSIIYFRSISWKIKNFMWRVRKKLRI